MGIEPTSEAWEASILPLYDARSEPYANKPMRLLQEFFNHKSMLECRVTLVGQALLPVPRDAAARAATSVSNLLRRGWGACTDRQECLSHAEDGLAYKDLREFIAKLEKEGELRRIAPEVDPVLEITEIADRVTRAGGPALLFERPKGSRVPLLINMLGSERRMNLALEVSHVDEVASRIRGFLDMQSPQGLLDKIKMLPKLAEIGSFFPKTVKTGPCKEVIRRENFSLLEF